MALATLEFQDNTHDSIMSPPYWWGVFGDLWEWTFFKHQLKGKATTLEAPFASKKVVLETFRGLPPFAPLLGHPGCKISLESHSQNLM